jgi:hypothetical protein
MTTQIVEGLELFSEAQLESLEFLPEELENIEFELYPSLESISLEVVAKDLEAYFEQTGFFSKAYLEANNSIKIEQPIDYSYFRVLTNLGAKVVVLFDATHNPRTEKPYHFEINLIINQQQADALSRRNPKIHRAFKLNTLTLTNRLKFELNAKSPGLRRLPQHRKTLIQDVKRSGRKIMQQIYP